MAALFLIAIVIVAANVQDADGQCLSDKSCNGHGRCPKTCSYKYDEACKCTGDYTGDYCQIPPDCTLGGNQCGDHGTCANLTCMCRDNYRGIHCQIAPICTENGNECGSYGECNTCNKVYPRCLCHSGYGGRTCEIAPVCTEGGNECKNGGVCNFYEQPYNCTCDPYFQHLGDTCGAHHVGIAMASLVLTLLGSLLMTET